LTVTKGGIAGSMPDGMGPFFLSAAARGEAGKPGSAPAVVSPPQTCHEVFFPPKTCHGSTRRQRVRNLIEWA